MRHRSDTAAWRPGSGTRLPLPILILLLSGVLLAPAAPSRAASGGKPTSHGQRAAIERVLADYTGLYARDTLESWKTLFHPALSVAWPDKDGTIQVRDLEGFFERQRNYFATGRRISERLENVHIDPGWRMARVSADFVFVDEGEERRGRLGLHLLQAGDAWRIVAILFSYDTEGR